MKLNAIELALVNNPIRDVLLRSSIGWLHHAACAPPLRHVLEVGCGQGAGVREIDRRFHPESVDAFDLDEQQVERARRNLTDLESHFALRLWTGDAERIEAANGRYDAVFEFAILHHVPGWRGALAEIPRVLRPGGVFLFEELSREFFTTVPILSPLLRRFTVHPWDTMFDFAVFRRALDDAGLRLRALRSHIIPGWHTGVAVRD